MSPAIVLGPFCCAVCGPRTRVPPSDAIEWRPEDLYPIFVFHVAQEMGEGR